MSLQETPSGERTHIAFFGCRNVGKSSLVNAVTGQELAVVSEIKGTTTDPVKKSMELLPFGPVVIIDTPGFDDEGALGEKRIGKTKQILNQTDIAVLVVDQSVGFTSVDEELLELIQEKKIPYLIVYNKSDLDHVLEGKPENKFSTPFMNTVSPAQSGICTSGEHALKGNAWNEEHAIAVSALTGENINELKGKLGKLMQEEKKEKRLAGDLIKPGDVVVLVTPIDESAPKGRLILPQQQALRDVLDAGAVAVVTKETELKETLRKLAEKPALVVTDSQVFAFVSKIVPEDVPLTSFSILMARYKGFLETTIEGVAAVKRLKEGDTVLIAEGCTHHRQCNDIGTVKIPRWLRETVGKDIRIETCSGTEFPNDLSSYALVIHCGGCMLNEREIGSRRDRAIGQGVPFLNYGIFIAYVTDVLERSLRIFPELHDLIIA